MGLFNRLYLVMFGCFVLVFAAASVFLYRQIDHQYIAELQATSERQMLTAQAVRKFTVDHVRSILLQDAKEFHPSAIPSFAATQVMNYLQASYPGHSYREVALNPTNPHNQASAWEVEAIQYFDRTNADSYAGMSGNGPNATYQFAKPIKVSSATCLTCHGDPSSAPPTMLAKYGDRHGFGWKLGEVVGAQVVSVPVTLAMQRRNDSLWNFFSTTLTLSVSGLIFLAIALRQAVVRPIETAGNAWRKLASEDPLTGAANRRSFLDVLGIMVNGVSAGSPVSVVFFDLDHFKQINDTSGHQAGDEVLKQVTRRVQGAIRRNDMLARYGGEEFALILPDTDEAGARIQASNLRNIVQQETIRVIDHHKVSVDLTVTASFGVAQVGLGEGVDHVLMRADQALYAAKHLGRNRVVMASEAATMEAHGAASSTLPVSGVAPHASSAA